VGHVEAGLRTSNIHSPWPEEMNRRLVSVIADLHFALTEAAHGNLLRENIDPARILVTGNTIIDALLEALAILDADQGRLADLQAALPRLDPGKRLILATDHWRESFAGGRAGPRRAWLAAPGRSRRC
jgi:UDP-N-acetylglucosamine 2-epimerase